MIAFFFLMLSATVNFRVMLWIFIGGVSYTHLFDAWTENPRPRSPSACQTKTNGSKQGCRGTGRGGDVSIYNAARKNEIEAIQNRHDVFRVLPETIDSSLKPHSRLPGRLYRSLSIPRATLHVVYLLYLLEANAAAANHFYNRSLLSPSGE